MSRKVSCGARSVCFLLPQYKGRDVSQTRNTHGISKALQYLKTHRRRVTSQSCAKFSSGCPHPLPSSLVAKTFEGLCQRLGWAAIAFCLCDARLKGRWPLALPGLSGIARLGDACRASAVFVGRNGSHFWTRHSKTAARCPNLKTPIWLIPARDPLCHHEFSRCPARARDAVAESIAAGLKGAEGNGH